MSSIHIRSRIGYWSAFATKDGSFLNIRDAKRETVTIRLEPADVETLLSGYDAAHAHASMLAEHGPRVDVLETPRVRLGEPAPYDWQGPARVTIVAESRTESRLAA